MQNVFKIGLCFILFSTGAAYCYSNSTRAAIACKNEEKPVYLDKNDPIFKTIKARAIADLRQCWQKADPASAQNIAIKEKMKTWSKEKQDEALAMFETAINDYSDQTGLDVATFMLVFDVLGKMEEKELSEEYDIRVLNAGSNKYIAEFFEDGIAVNSEAHAIASTDDPEYRAAAKETYANVRKAIEDGEQERYTKVMALFYTQEKNNIIAFHDPMQSVYDYIESLK
jgi:hypothetical protein